MYKNPAKLVAAFSLLIIVSAAAIAQNQPAAADASPPTSSGSHVTPAPESSAITGSPTGHQNGMVDTQTSSGTPKIKALLVAPSGDPAGDHVAFNSKLAVELDTPLVHPADQYVLFLNDTEVKGVGPPVYTTLRNGKRALVFKLVRDSDNSAFWKELLGAPKHFTIPVIVGLGERAEPCKTTLPCRSPEITIMGASNPASFEFNLISGPWLAIAIIAVGVVVFLVWGHARSSTTLRDNLLPQLPPNRQPYSLARWQMAFWFVLIFASFVFLYLLLWDYNVVSPQALGLMGIAGATALAAVAIDVSKESPADDANRALQALGLHTYADVLRVQTEIAARQAQLNAAQKGVATERTALQQAHVADRELRLLQAEIQDRQNILRTYEDRTQQFVSEGWFKDITTDLNGPTVHRIQVLCWTVTLGLVFLVGVYRDLAMPPDFSATLLALMGISSAGYVGFKYPEKNN